MPGVYRFLLAGFKGPFNLALTMESEQFIDSVWKRVNGKYRKVLSVNGKVVGVELQQKPGGVLVSIYHPPNQVENLTGKVLGLVKEMLRVEDDFNLIYRELSRDPVMKNLLKIYNGLRLVKYADLFECLMVFLLSANTNLKRLNQMVSLLTRVFGVPFRFPDGQVLHSFPQPEALSNVDVRVLREKCKLGYKAEYVLKLSRILVRGDFNLEELERVKPHEARLNLKRLPGVGDKVADAFLLYGLGVTEACPVDIWVKRALSKLYGYKTASYNAAQSFLRGLFGRYVGYAHPIIYYHAFSKRLDNFK